jgi:hypothetical protein
MRNTPLLISGLLVTVLASAAGARDMTVQDTRQVLGEAAAARDALVHGKRAVAKDLVQRALTLDTRLARHHPRVTLAEGNAPETVDLVRTQHALAEAKTDIASGRIAEAERALEHVTQSAAPPVAARRVTRATR